MSAYSPLMECTLQVNVSGSWRNVIKFLPMLIAEIKPAAALLARAGGVPMRIAQDGMSIESCRAPMYDWSTQL